MEYMLPNNMQLAVSQTARNKKLKIIKLASNTYLLNKLNNAMTSEKVL